MKIKKQNISLPIKNHDDLGFENKINKHGFLFGGESKRGLIVGPSGSGKTNVILSLIEHPNGLRFKNIYLYSKSLYQPKYSYLRTLLKPVKEIGYEEFDDPKDIIGPEEIKDNSVIIFDDVASCDQNIIQKYFCFGRHKHTDCFYLCQTYSAVPKQLIRDNANLIIMFQQDVTNLKHIYDDHVNIDMSYQDFKEICSYCWANKFEFLTIDKDCLMSSGRYRKGFDTFISI